MSATPARLDVPRWRTARVRPSIAAVAIGLAALPLLPERAVADGPVLCPFRRVTGLPCPGCGMTRSMTQFAHGEWRTSFGEHLLGPVVYVALVATVIASIGWRLGSTTDVWSRFWRSPRLRTVFVVLGVAWAAWAAVRLGRAVVDGTV